MPRFFSVGGDALRACDVHEGFVAHAMSGLRSCAEVLQFLGRIEKAFITPGNVIVHLDAENVARLCVADNGFGIVRAQTIGADTHVVRPILLGFIALRGPAEQQQTPQK